MEGIAVNQFKCAQGDFACYCGNPDFGYGVRDCSNQACGSPDAASSVISYASSFCAGKCICERWASIARRLTRIVTAVLATASNMPKSTGALSVIASAAATTTTVAQGAVRTVTTTLGGKSCWFVHCLVM